MMARTARWQQATEETQSDTESGGQRRR